MKGNSIIFIFKTIMFAALASAILYGCQMVISNSAQARAEYAKAHNCRWDYNDMCYTIDERPWLFK